MKTLFATLATTIALIGFAAAEDAKFEDISIKDLDKAIKDKTVVVIDVNGADSYKQAHVPTAIDYATQKDKLAKLLPEDKGTLVVAYCGGPSCGAYQAAAKAAKELGYTNVKHLKAGLSGWLAAEMKVEKGAPGEKES